MHELPAGTQIGGYRVLSLIGRGGMGVVYLAEHAGLERRVALKVLAPQFATDASFRARFERESRLAAALDHPNVIPIYEAGEADGMLFIAMRYVAGPDLRAVLDREGRFDVGRTLAIGAQLAGALDAAHASGLIHRDVKPGNVLLAAGHAADGGEHVYLTDFGLTKHSASKSGLTQLGQMVGTIDYIAPEQISGEPVDGRADIYALGCVLFEMLAGRSPYARDSDLATMAAHLHEPPPKISPIRPDLPPAADELIATALAKQPASRFASAAELVRQARIALMPGGQPATVSEWAITSQPTVPIGVPAGAVGTPTVLAGTGSEEASPRAPTVLQQAAFPFPQPPSNQLPPGDQRSLGAQGAYPPPGSQPPDPLIIQPDLRTHDDVAAARQAGVMLIIVGVLALLGGALVLFLLPRLPQADRLAIGLIGVGNLVAGPLFVIVGVLLRRGVRSMRLPAMGLGALAAVASAIDILSSLGSGVPLTTIATGVARLFLGLAILRNVRRISAWAPDPARTQSSGGGALATSVMLAIIGVSVLIFAGTGLAYLGGSQATPGPTFVGPASFTPRPSSAPTSQPTTPTPSLDPSPSPSVSASPSPSPSRSPTPTPSAQVTSPPSAAAAFARLRELVPLDDEPDVDPCGQYFESPFYDEGTLEMPELFCTAELGDDIISVSYWLFGDAVALATGYDAFLEYLGISSDDAPSCFDSGPPCEGEFNITGELAGNVAGLAFDAGGSGLVWTHRNEFVLAYVSDSQARFRQVFDHWRDGNLLVVQ